MHWLHGGAGSEIGGAGAAADFRSGEATLHESFIVHGANGRRDFTAVYSVYRRECARSHGGEGEGGWVHGVSVGCQCDGGVFGEFDEFLGDEAHERLDAAGVGQCEGGRRRRGVGVDI